MNQQSILPGDLLDIIFENRNKDYGAYKLRKTYQSRLSIAVFSTAGMALLVSLFLLFRNSTAVFVPVPPGISIPGAKIFNFRGLPQPANKKILMHHTAVKSMPQRISYTRRPPLIVASDKINILPATPAQIQSSVLGTSVLGENSVLNLDGLDGNGATVTKELPGPDKSIPLEAAEIMPRYPGGIRALLLFLKKNIHSPASVEGGEDVTVKIEFVVNYNGNSENFIVVKSGGEIFDNEVLRVLKKMPLWIPGKSNGRNVSVYYTVPVKFTSEF